MGKSAKRLTASALLIAIGILIPMVSPVKIIIGPASFTLGSHVPIFIALFISPFSAIAVSLGTTFGFAIAGFPTIITLRAATHVIFATLGAFYIQKNANLLKSPVKTQLFSFALGVIHGAAELAVVSFFYFGNLLPGTYYDKGFLIGVLGLVGIGSIVHSMLDFEMALIVTKAVSRQKAIGVFSELNQSKATDNVLK